MTNFNTKKNDTRNFLTLGEYIICKDLHYSLESGVLHNNGVPVTIDTKKFYVVMIRVLNRDSRSLVYNYISYPYVFYYIFMFFLCTRSKLMEGSYKEPGKFLSIVYKFLDSEPVDDKLTISKSLLYI